MGIGPTSVTTVFDVWPLRESPSQHCHRPPNRGDRPFRIRCTFGHTLGQLRECSTGPTSARPDTSAWLSNCFHSIGLDTAISGLARVGLVEELSPIACPRSTGLPR
jgi:hypothetical protein